MSSLNNLDKYLHYYSDTTFDKFEINEADYLYLSLLAYLHIDKVDDNTSYLDFCDIALSQMPSVKYGRVTCKIKEIITTYKNSLRYKDMLVSHYQYIINEYTQFGAMVFIINDEAIVSFTGSDGSVIGWYENLRQSFKFPVYTQELARKYLLDIIDEYKTISIVGHSKGGNLAMYSAFYLSDENLNKIKHIYNYDGPGFFKEIIESNDYKRIEDKIVNYIPEDSYIGAMMYQGGKTKIVKTTVKGIDVHFVFNWVLFGGCVDESTSFSERYNYVHHTTTVRWDKLDKKEVEKTVENTFIILNLDKTSKLKLRMSDIKKAIAYNKKNELVNRKDFREMIKVFIYADPSLLKLSRFKRKREK